MLIRFIRVISCKKATPPPKTSPGPESIRTVGRKSNLNTHIEFLFFMTLRRLEISVEHLFVRLYLDVVLGAVGGVGDE